MIRRFYQKHKHTLTLFDGFFLNNTVLERGLVIAPIIVAGNTMKNAVMLSIAFVIITFFTVLVSSFIPKKLPYTIRAIMHTVLAAILFIPVSYFLQGYFPEAVYKAGIFLPLLVTNSLIVSKGESRFFKKTRGVMAVDLLSHVLGFSLVACIVGTIREILGSGSFWEIPLGLGETAPMLMFPLAGFILLGFLAAALQKFRLYVTREPKALAKEETAPDGSEQPESAN